ncbi:glutamate--cysteine ligase [Prochlorococcus marinus]|uniref:Glutamate--cysteine ligase n=1 Tax=Prochlorococcus marinus (strain MIT 9211) TaxID=93059 RepID=A9BCR5_PROM4|nr:glutamate--cysteine ligase [Prochlorococcus marinus]ABX09627.1 Glutamate--cysteine ligase [Prochlorococcus marinus str. MIT 9211]
MNNSLLKGFEVELFTGRLSGENVGVSDAVSKEFPEFVIEPDKRNLEYITIPDREYKHLNESLLAPRRKLRNWLALQELTILPGSTLSLGDSRKFERSDLSNPYHDFIESNYGTKVVTASVHINLGLEDLSLLFAALRLVRCEAALFLALSASSPFLDGKLTGVHSQRWIQFPVTPKDVPLFLNHGHYVTWIEEQLREGGMHNERHLWISVRANGPERPYKLNRLELRICDLITNCDLLLAVTTLLELRVLCLCNNPKKLDPLEGSLLSPQELSKLIDMNEKASATTSLDATLRDWVDGKEILCREWIAQLISDVTPLAKDMGLFHQLSPINSVLEDGNQSMQWIRAHSNGIDLPDLLKETIHEMENEEKLSPMMHRRV